jgi:hypothetical protein
MLEKLQKQENMTEIKFNFQGLAIQAIHSRFSVLWPGVASFFITSALYYAIQPILMTISIAVATEITTALPNLFGFTLGGYALIIGLGNEKLLQIICEIPPRKKTSLYQQLNAAFSLTLIIQFFAFLVGLFYKLVFSDNKPMQGLSITILQKYILFAVFFLSFWSLLALLDIAMKIFNIAQLQFLQLRKNKR